MAKINIKKNIKIYVFGTITNCNTFSSFLYLANVVY